MAPVVPNPKKIKSFRTEAAFAGGGRRFALLLWLELGTSSDCEAEYYKA